nr:MAG TPA: hypothetical protein [Caudoviricetes sp.]
MRHFALRDSRCREHACCIFVTNRREAEQKCVNS